jgi:hypothetical protein
MSLPCLLPADALPGGRLPSRGSLGPHFPTFIGTMHRYDCHPARLGGLRLSLAAPIPCLLPWVRGVPVGLVARAEAPGHARAFGHPVPHSGYETRRQVALPSSQVPPLETCPALRPRWCPAHSPYRAQDCCLPVTGNRRLSPRYHLEGHPLDHDYTHFGAQSRGLHPHYTRLRTAPYGEARGFAPDRLARR